MTILPKCTGGTLGLLEWCIFRQTDMNGMNVKHSSGKRSFASRFYFKMKMYSCGHGLRPSAVFAITSPAVAKLTAFFKIHTQCFFSLLKYFLSHMNQGTFPQIEGPCSKICKATWTHLGFFFSVLGFINETDLMLGTWCSNTSDWRRWSCHLADWSVDELWQTQGLWESGC